MIFMRKCYRTLWWVSARRCALLFDSRLSFRPGDRAERAAGNATQRKVNARAHAFHRPRAADRSADGGNYICFLARLADHWWAERVRDAGTENRINSKLSVFGFPLSVSLLLLGDCRLAPSYGRALPIRLISLLTFHRNNAIMNWWRAKETQNNEIEMLNGQANYVSIINGNYFQIIFEYLSVLFSIVSSSVLRLSSVSPSYRL